MSTAQIRPALWMGVLLAAATIAVYAQVVHHDFVNWDDHDYVVDNPVVSRGLSLRGVAWAFTNRHSATWHPLASLSHMLDVQLWGLWPGGHHLTSVVLHVVAALLLLGLLHTLTGRLAASAFVAGVFALHPLRAESVAWVSERKDVLSGVLWIVTLWCWARWVRQPSGQRYAVVLAAYLLACLAKPMVVTLPIVLLLLDVWPLARDLPLRRRLVEKVPLVVMAGVVSVVTFIVQERAGGVATLEQLRVVDRVANATVACAWYVEKTLWPSSLAVFYPLRLPIPLWTFALSAVLVVGATAVAWRTRRTLPWLFVGWFWFLVTMLPVIGLVRVGRQAMADRYTYVPGIGIAMIIAWGGVALVRAYPSTKRIVAPMAAVVLVALAAASWVQVGYWRNDVALYERALAVTEDNFVAHTNLGSALLARDRVAEALRHYEEAVRIDPGSAQAHANMGVALAAGGDSGAALAEFQQALARDDRDAGTHVRAADVLARQGRIDDAIAHYRSASRLEPGSAAVRNNLGFLLGTRGKLDEAVEEYEAALAAEPDMAAAHNNLALAVEQLGQRDVALRHYRKAVELVPDDPGNRLNYARALYRAGHGDEALAELREAVRRHPDAIAVHQDLIRMLTGDANPARRREAAALADALARKVQTPDAELLSTVARAYEGVGRFADALRIWAEATKVARATGRGDLLPAIEAAMQGCEERIEATP